MGREMNKRLDSRRDGTTRRSHENQRLQMEVRWPCSQWEQKSHIVWMHEGETGYHQERQNEEGPETDGRMTSGCMQNQTGLRRQQTDISGRT